MPNHGGFLYCLSSFLLALKILICSRASYGPCEGLNLVNGELYRVPTGRCHCIPLRRKSDGIPERPNGLPSDEMERFFVCEVKFGRLMRGCGVTSWFP